MTAGTIAGLLDDCAARRPDRPLLRDVAGETLTVSQVAGLASAAAEWLADAGVRSGMTVAWQLPSHVNAAVVMLALARMSVAQAPVLHLYRRREVCAAVDVARADILLVDDTLPLRPRIVAVIAAGRLVHLTEAHRLVHAPVARKAVAAA